MAALALFCGIAVTGWWMRGHGMQEEVRAESTSVKSVLHLDTFVINLADADQKTYLRLGVDLGLDHPAAEKDQSAAVPVALVRDAIVGVLAVAKPDELLTPNGKVKLKADLIEALRQRAPALGVREIYFTEFLIQR
jgi:flagellar FliL protein